MNRAFSCATMVLALIAICAAIVLWLRVEELSSAQRLVSADLAKIREAKKPFSIKGYLCPRENWCEVDFSRLAAHPETVAGKRVLILGFLAIDNGVVSLFASKEAFLQMEHGRSLEVAGSRTQLNALMTEFANKYVRLEGTYELPAQGRRRSRRLGILVQPVSASEVLPRLGSQGVDDILVDVRYPDN